jgi:glycosyltransferase involved in cell wall biosynthesis
VRILVVSNGYPPRGKWGTEFYTQELVRGLAARGHELAVLHPERSGAKPRGTVVEVSERGVPVYLLHNAGDPARSFAQSYADPAAERAFEDVLARVQPDLVHFTYLLWGLSVRMVALAEERGVPSVITLTDYGLLCHRGQMFDHRLRACGGPHPPSVCARCIRTPSRWDGARFAMLAKRAAAGAAAAAGGLGRVVVARDLERREAAARDALGRARVLIAPTRVLAEAFRAFGAPEERLTELVYAFDEAPWRAARAEPTGETHVFAFLGQLAPHKGVEALLEAVRRMEHRLPESVEPWELRIYGAPSAGRNHRFGPALFARDLGPRVRFEPPFEPEDAPEVFGELATIVVPSEWDENAPLTVLQARAAGIPVVGSDVRGIAEIVGPEHGRLFPAGDAGALADALRGELLARRRRTSAPGLPLSLAAHLDRIEAAYRRAVGESFRTVPGTLRKDSPGVRDASEAPNGPAARDATELRDGRIVP